MRHTISEFWWRTCLAIAVGCGIAVADVHAEDFSAGNPVQSTDYFLINAGAYSGTTQYRVVSDPSNELLNGYAHFYDHTYGTAAGQMLFFDASGLSSDRIWYRTVNLNTGTNYNFSFWGAAADGVSVPQLYARIDGVDLAGSLTTISGLWQQFLTCPQVWNQFLS